jgi:hypothetical protein
MVLSRTLFITPISIMMSTFPLGTTSFLQLRICTKHALSWTQKYVPQDDVATASFEEMQIFMYAVMAEHLRMDEKIISESV